MRGSRLNSHKHLPWAAMTITERQPVTIVFVVVWTTVAKAESGSTFP